MNKYTNFNEMTEQVKNDFDQDIILAKQKDLINEIIKLKDKYLLAKSEFEQDEIQSVQKSIKSDGLVNKQIIYKNEEDENLLAKSVLADEKYNDFVSTSDSLKSQIKQSKFKLFYLNSLKNQAIKDCNIAKAVALTDKINECENLTNAINFKLESLNSDIKNSEIEFFERYLELLNFVVSEKVNLSLDKLSQKFASDVVDYFVTNKMIFVICKYLAMVDLSKIIDAMDSEELKSIFGGVVSKIISGLQKCGNK